MISDKHLVVFVLIIESITLALLILGTAIPQTRPGPFYELDRQQLPKKNVRMYIILTSWSTVIIYSSFFNNLLGKRYFG